MSVVSQAPQPVAPLAPDGARREVRHAVFWRARVDVPGSPPVDARVVDVSLQGLGLACELPFAAGARLLMMAVVLHPEYLTPTAIVPLSCRVADQTMSGVFRMEAVLENISDTSRRLLQQVLRHRRRR